MEYVVEILTNDIVNKIYRFTNRHEAISKYLELDFKYNDSVATYVRDRRVKRAMQ